MSVYKLLDKYTRKQLESYMIDCMGMDQSMCDEWPTKSDIISDMVNSNYQESVIDYLGGAPKGWGVVSC